MTSTAKEEIAETDKGNKYFLISARWVKNLVLFLKSLKNNPDKYAKNFNRDKVLLLYFNEDLGSDNIGYYPGPVNNFEISDFKRCWFDPDETKKHTHTFVIPGIKENVEFFFVNEESWNFIKSVFGCDYPIERHVVNLTNDTVIEVNLRKVRPLLIL